jgi:hypothetical protein
MEKEKLRKKKCLEGGFFLRSVVFISGRIKQRYPYLSPLQRNRLPTLLAEEEEEGRRFLRGGA